MCNTLCNDTNFDRLAVNDFQRDANKVQFDLVGDSENMSIVKKQIKKWDRKKKKMVNVNLVSDAIFVVVVSVYTLL